MKHGGVGDEVGDVVRVGGRKGGAGGGGLELEGYWNVCQVVVMLVMR